MRVGFISLPRRLRRTNRCSRPGQALRLSFVPRGSPRRLSGVFGDGGRVLAESFADRWTRREHECGIDAIAAKMVACGSDLLPDSAAPFLAFKEAERPIPVWEAYGSASGWSPADCERLAAYRMVGSDGAGNPVCVEQGAGEVVLLDHEDGFRTRQFVNSSVSQLAECLLAFMGERDPERFRSAVRAIDPAALAERSFWWQEAAGLGAEAGQ